MMASMLSDVTATERLDSDLDLKSTFTRQKDDNSRLDSELTIHSDKIENADKAGTDEISKSHSRDTRDKVSEPNETSRDCVPQNPQQVEGSTRPSPPGQQTPIMTNPASKHRLDKQAGKPASSKREMLKSKLSDLQHEKARLGRILEGHMKDHSTESSTMTKDPPSAMLTNKRKRPEEDDEEVSKMESSARGEHIDEKALVTFAKQRIQEHITLLQEYNKIRDVGQGLIGMVADRRRVRVRDCQEEFGVTAED